MAHSLTSLTKLMESRLAINAFKCQSLPPECGTMAPVNLDKIPAKNLPHLNQKPLSNTLKLQGLKSEIKNGG